MPFFGLNGGIIVGNPLVRDDFQGMPNKDIHFSISQIVVDDRPIKFSDFSSIPSEVTEPEKIRSEENKEEVLSLLTMKKEEYDGRFICLWIQEGDRFPYQETVVNVSDSANIQITGNPRSPDQIELSDELFVILDAKTSRIFISNYRKKNHFLSWLKDKLDNEQIVVKPIIPEENFLQKMRGLNEVCFTVAPNLFTLSKGTLSEALTQDIFGFEAEEATIKFSYKDKAISDRMIRKLEDLLDRKQDFKDLTIVGRMSDNFESILNMNEVIGKVSISIEINETTQKVDHTKVFSALILKIQN